MGSKSVKQLTEALWEICACQLPTLILPSASKWIWQLFIPREKAEDYSWKQTEQSMGGSGVGEAQRQREGKRELDIDR